MEAPIALVRPDLLRPWRATVSVSLIICFAFAERLGVDDLDEEEPFSFEPTQPLLEEKAQAFNQQPHLGPQELLQLDETNYARAQQQQLLENRILGARLEAAAGAEQSFHLASRSAASAKGHSGLAMQSAGAATSKAVHRGYARAVVSNVSSAWIITNAHPEVITNAPPEESEDLRTEEEKAARIKALHGHEHLKLTAEQVEELRDMERELDSGSSLPREGLLSSLADKPMLLAVAGGIGASIGNMGSLLLDKDLIQRAKIQDLFVMLLLLFVYFATLSFSACLAHRQARNSSRVKYYADPRAYVDVAEHTNTMDFLEAFNQHPKQVQLQVTGFLPTMQDFPNAFSWRDGIYAPSFAFALDLLPWVVRGDPSEGNDADDDGPEVGVDAEDLDQLRQFLDEDTNDLAVVEMHKQIYWKNFEDLATNIKHQIRQCGFQGVIHVDYTQHEVMGIYKNTQWANFMHGKAFKILLALSIVGWLLYVPYMWIRTKSLRVRCRHTVNVSIDEYWRFICDGLSQHGFQVSSGSFTVQQQFHPDGRVAGFVAETVDSSDSEIDTSF